MAEDVHAKEEITVFGLFFFFYAVAVAAVLSVVLAEDAAVVTADAAVFSGLSSFFAVVMAAVSDADVRPLPIMLKHSRI